METSKALFTTEMTMTKKEYTRFSKKVYDVFQAEHKKTMTLGILVGILGVVSGLSSKQYIWVAAGVFIAVIMLLLTVVQKRMKISDAYDRNQKIHDRVDKISFFEDAVVAHSKFGAVRIEYDDVVEIIETRTNFYIMKSADAGIIVVKNNCSAELISYLQGLKSRCGAGKNTLKKTVKG